MPREIELHLPEGGVIGGLVQVHVDGALYPLAPWFQGELPENIGLLLGFARGSDVTIALSSYMGVTGKGVKSLAPTIKR